MKSLRIAVLPLILVACSDEDSSTIRGSISDGGGDQPQAKFGGSGTVQAAAKVTAHTINTDGSLEAVGEADVAAGGAYELSVPSGQDRVIVRAVDSSGKVLAAAVVDSTGAAGSEIVAPPIDTETSVEAEVLVKMIASGVRPEEANPVDMRARINKEVAAAVKATASAAQEGKTKALAEAVAAAQATEVEAYADMGITTSQSALFDAELAASQKLSAGLDAGSRTASDLYTEFFAELQAAAEGAGADAEEQARAEQCAGIALRATIDARVLNVGAGRDAVADAAIRQGAAAEARLSSAAIKAIMTGAGAAAAVQTKANQVGSDLRASVQGATTAAASAQAFADFNVEVIGGTDTSLIALFLGVDAGNDPQVGAALQATSDAGASLTAGLDATLGALLSITGAIDFDAVASGVVGAYGTFSTTVQSQAGSALATFGADADPAVSLLVVAEGSFQLGQ